MKNIKLFPKIFLYTFTIMSFLIIISHLLVYFIFPITYLADRKETIQQTADSLVKSIDGKEQSLITQSLELFSENNDVQVLLKSESMDNVIDVKDRITINHDSQDNSLIIEERKVTTSTGDSLTLQFISSKDMKREARNLSLSFLPYTIIISVIVSLIISYCYTKFIVSPILHITKVTNHMMKLEKEALLKVTSNDEIGNLKHQINTLYTRLLGVIEDLDKKNKEIVGLEKRKVDFLRSMSHELKTPLASLRILLENMKYNIGKYKDRDTYLDVSLKMIDQLTSMIVDILTISSFQEIEGDKESLNLNQEVNMILEDYILLAQHKQIKINNLLTVETIYMSKRALHKILANLISNAIKYSYENGEITIGIKNDYFFIKIPVNL